MTINTHSAVNVYNAYIRPYILSRSASSQKVVKTEPLLNGDKLKGHRGAVNEIK